MLNNIIKLNGLKCSYLCLLSTCTNISDLTVTKHAFSHLIKILLIKPSMLNNIMYD